MSTLDHVLALTDEIERNIDAGDWLGASTLDAERHAVLIEMFADRSIDEFDRSTRQALAEIRDRTRRSVDHVRVLKKQLVEQSTPLQAAPRALHSYAQNKSTHPTGLNR